MIVEFEMVGCSLNERVPLDLKDSFKMPEKASYADERSTQSKQR